MQSGSPGVRIHTVLRERPIAPCPSRPSTRPPLRPDPWAEVTDGLRSHTDRGRRNSPQVRFDRGAAVLGSLRPAQHAERIGELLRHRSVGGGRRPGVGVGADLRTPQARRRHRRTSDCQTAERDHGETGASTTSDFSPGCRSRRPSGGSGGYHVLQLRQNGRHCVWHSMDALLVTSAVSSKTSGWQQSGTQAGSPRLDTLAHQPAASSRSREAISPSPCSSRIGHDRLAKNPPGKSSSRGSKGRSSRQASARPLQCVVARTRGGLSRRRRAPSSTTFHDDAHAQHVAGDPSTMAGVAPSRPARIEAVAASSSAPMKVSAARSAASFSVAALANSGRAGPTARAPCRRWRTHWFAAVRSSSSAGQITVRESPCFWICPDAEICDRVAWDAARSPLLDALSQP